MLFHHPSYILAFHLTYCHFHLLPVPILLVLFTNVVVFCLLRSTVVYTTIWTLPISDAKLVTLLAQAVIVFSVKVLPVTVAVW